MRKGKRKALGAAGVGFPGSEADYRSGSYRVHGGDDDGPGVAPAGADAAVSRMHPPKLISNDEVLLVGALLACGLGWALIGVDDAEDADPAVKGFVAGDRA